MGADGGRGSCPPAGRKSVGSNPSRAARGGKFLIHGIVRGIAPIV